MINAQYSVVLKTLMDNEQTKAALNKALSTYPLYEKKSKEEYIPSIVPTREQLNQKILNRYKYREIGFETVGRFLDELEIAMCEIMPRYNQLFFSVDQDYNIIYNVDYQRTIDRNLDGENKSNSTGTAENETISTNNIESTTNDTSTNNTTATDETIQNTTMTDADKKVHSETPQGQINITAKNIDTVPYADDVEWNKKTSESNSTSNGESTSQGTTSSNGTTSTTGENNVKQTGSNTTAGEDTRKETESTLETTKGNFGVVSAQDLVAKYREIIINIEQMILNDRRIVELFMLVY